MDDAVKDPKGLIREAYRIDAITAEECRSIFLDWALSMPDSQNPQALIMALLAQYEADHPDHPMTETLRAGIAEAPSARRRGGRKARLAQDGT